MVPSLVAAAVMAAAAPGGSALPWLADDYARALAEARARDVPILADVWTPWCHTCRFMKASVLGDARLLKQAGRFVWLSIDAEMERNAPFLERYPTGSYPTFVVIDPGAEKPVLRWSGAAGVKQFERLLDDALVALRAAAASGPEAALARADRLGAEGRNEEAAAAYREALGAGGVAWDRRGRAAESLLAALASAGRLEECAATAEDTRLPRGPSQAAVTSAGLSCALRAPADAPWRAGAMARLERMVRAAARAPGLLPDDQAFILETLAEARAESGDEKGARACWRRLWALLESEARRTPSIELRAALDSFRVSAAIGMGKPALAVPELRRSEEALPEDYNPPYRLALLYEEMGLHREAVTAADRALARAYGPRKLRVYAIKLQAQGGQGDAAGRRRTLQEALAHAAALPPVQRGGSAAKLVERWKAQLADAE